MSVYPEKLSLWKLFFLFTFLVGYVESQGHFVKEQRTDQHQFPPDLGIPIKGIPQGHLRPLGYHRRSEGKVKILGKESNITGFFAQCLDKKSPCFLPKHYKPPAKLIWGDKHLADTFGKETIKVDTVKKGPPPLDAKMMEIPLTKYLRQYHYEEWKSATLLPEPMKTDLTVPNYLQCPTQIESLAYVELWLQSGEVSTVLSSGFQDEFHCVISGRSDFIIIHPKFAKNLYMHERGTPPQDHSITGMDVDQLNLFKNPQIGGVTWKWASLYPTDCLFLPAGTIRHVRTYGRTLNVVFKNIPMPAYPKKCNVEPDPNMPLDQLHSLWKVQNGLLKLSPPEVWTPDLIRKYLLASMGRKSEYTIYAFNRVFSGVSPKLTPKLLKIGFERFFDIVRDRKTVSKERFTRIVGRASSLHWLAKYFQSKISGVPVRDEL